MSARGTLAITLDVDWAPDFMIDHAAELLRAGGARATWFVTHDSGATRRLRDDDRFEIGVHPNFLPGSTHGATPDEVLGAMRRLVPDATVLRTHGLMQSTPLLQAAVERHGYTVDASLFLPGARGLQPHAVRFSAGGPALRRVPYTWEDDFAMYDPATDHANVSGLDAPDGLQIFDFHPVHVYLNSADMGPYEALKAGVGLRHATADNAAAFQNRERPGTADVFRAVIAAAAARPDRGAHLTEIVAAWEAACGS